MTAIRSERLGADRLGPAHSGAETFSSGPAGSGNAGDIAQVTAVESDIREFVRRDVSFLRRPRQNDEHATPLAREPAGEKVSEDLNSLIRRVSGASMEEIDRVILELQACATFCAMKASASPAKSPATPASAMRRPRR